MKELKKLKKMRMFKHGEDQIDAPVKYDFMPLKNFKPIERDMKPSFEDIKDKIYVLENGKFKKVDLDND